MRVVLAVTMALAVVPGVAMGQAGMRGEPSDSEIGRSLNMLGFPNTPETRQAAKEFLQMQRGRRPEPAAGRGNRTAEARATDGLAVVPAAEEHGAKTEPPVPPKEAPKTETESEKLTRRTGEVSLKYESSREALRAAYQKMEQDFKEVQGLDRLQRELAESAKVNAMGEFLGVLGRRGDRVLADEEAFKEAFQQLRKAALDAAGQFQATADYLRSLSHEAVYPESKAMYEKAADWYAARSKRAARDASLEQTDYRTVRLKLQAMVRTVHVLETVASKDPYAFQAERDRILQLAEFANYYRKFGEFLQQSTSKILKGLSEDGEQAPPEEPASRPDEPRRSRVVLASLAGGPGTGPAATASAAADLGGGGRRYLLWETGGIGLLAMVVHRVRRWAVRG